MVVPAPPSSELAAFGAEKARGRWLWILGFAALTLVVCALGLLYYRAEASRIDSEKYNEIAAIASLKAQQIELWRQERKADARRLAESGSVRAAFEQCLRNPRDLAARDFLRERIALETRVDVYSDVVLLDPKGNPWLSATDPPNPFGAESRRTAGVSLTERSPVLSELHREPKGGVSLDVAEAVRDASGHALGVVLLSTDAAAFLYPMIQSWPTPSRTAETLLVRREGDAVTYLNPLRHLRNEPLAWNVSLDRRDLPAVRAVLGLRGRYLGSDYRGEQVLADVRPIPNTTWFMVAKVDTSEVFSELRYRAFAVVVVVAVIIVAAAGLTGYAYRSRQSAERMRAFEQIARSEARLKESQRVASLGHYELDAKAGTWTGSETLDEVFGIGPSYQRDVPGWMQVIHPDDRAEMLGYLSEHVLGAGKPFDKEYRIVRVNDGAERWVHGLGRLEVGSTGQIARMFGTIQDVTERKELEDVLRQRNEELLRFVYTVSHDLKSPLVTIRTFLGFLEQDLDQDDPVRTTTDMGYIRRAAETMARLLDELLDLARVGRTKHAPENILLQDLIRDVLDLVAGQIADRRVQVQVTDVPIVIRGDRERLLEVFENLVDNAVKFMGAQPEPRVEIGAETGGAETIIFVRDNGSGIDSRHKSKLFGLFEKLHPGTEGSGIGLALVKRIIEVHGGRVWAESPGPGLGSTFRIVLPEAARQQ
jgi:PAS domain S-box-containing protein